jgi:hypothetical protein
LPTLLPPLTSVILIFHAVVYRMYSGSTSAVWLFVHTSASPRHRELMGVDVMGSIFPVTRLHHAHPGCTSTASPCVSSSCTRATQARIPAPVAQCSVEIPERTTRRAWHPMLPHIKEQLVTRSQGFHGIAAAGPPEAICGVLYGDIDMVGREGCSRLQPLQL